MFGIGGFELFLIVVFAFLIIGPDKLPAIAKSAGKAIAKFRDAKNEVDKVIKTEVYDPNAEDPFKAPIDTLQKMGDSVENAKTGETFSERKARYDAERADARKAAQKAKQAENAAVSAAGVAELAARPAPAPAPAASELGAVGSSGCAAPSTSVGSGFEKTPDLDPAELFTAKPIVEVSAAPVQPVSTEGGQAARETQEVRETQAVQTNQNEQSDCADQVSRTEEAN